MAPEEIPYSRRSQSTLMGKKEWVFSPLPRDVSVENLAPKDHFYRRLDLSFVSAGSLRFALRRRGVTAPVTDCVIAAAAESLGGHLLRRAFRRTRS